MPIIRTCRGLSTSRTVPQSGVIAYVFLLSGAMRMLKLSLDEDGEGVRWTPQLALADGVLAHCKGLRDRCGVGDVGAIGQWIRLRRFRCELRIEDSHHHHSKCKIQFRGFAGYGGPCSGFCDDGVILEGIWQVMKNLIL